MSADNEARTRQKLHNRATAYKAVFMVGPSAPPDAEIAPAAEVVLRDLAAYCYANKPTLKISPQTGMVDSHAMAFAEGRRDVFNRLTALCGLTEAQIARIAHNRESET